MPNDSRSPKTPRHACHSCEIGDPTVYPVRGNALRNCTLSDAGQARSQDLLDTRKDLSTQVEKMYTI
jgi:hypothetical protein